MDVTAIYVGGHAEKLISLTIQSTNCVLQPDQMEQALKHVRKHSIAHLAGAACHAANQFIRELIVIW